MLTLHSLLVFWNTMLDKGIDLGFAIVQALLIASFTTFFLNRLFIKQKNIGKGLSEYGIAKVNIGKGTLNRKDVHILFGLSGRQRPREIKLCFITGFAFLRDYQPLLEEVVSHGTKVKLLLGNPTRGTFYNAYKVAGTMDITLFVDDILNYYLPKYQKDCNQLTCFLEREFLMLSHNKIKHVKDDAAKKKLLKHLIEDAGDDVWQVYLAEQRVKQINAHAKNGGGIELRFYEDEYQMPIIMAKYDTFKKKDGKTLLWSNMNAPIKETSESINVFCKRKDSDANPYLEDVETTFDYLFNLYK